MKKCTKYFDENKSLEDWKLKMSLEDAGLGEKMKEIESEIKSIVEDASSIPVANSKNNDDE